MKTFNHSIMVILSFLVLSCQSPETINIGVSTWFDQLPACPCENPDRKGVKTHDGWATDEGNINKFHKGATICFRSYPPIRTNEGMSSQQCCYDEKGRLITNGSGAGTPDKESTCDNEDAKGFMTLRLSGVIGHYNKDVKPWEAFGGVDSGWVNYNLFWIPNNRNKCSGNFVAPH